MKKITLLSIVTVTLLMTGCDNSTVKDVTAKANDAASKAVEVAKEKAAEVAKDTKAKALEAVEEAKAKAAEALEEAKTKAAEVAEAAKAKAAEAMDAAKDKAAEAVEVAKTKTTEAVDATKAKAEEATEAVKTTVSEATGDAKGKSLYAKCAGCHGADGKTKALGKSAPIAGVSVDALITDLKGYREGTLNKHAMGSLMKGQVATLDDEEIQALSSYIASLK